MGVTEAEPTPVIVIEGLRASSESAERLRRAADGIVDSVLAAEFHRLPDLSVADAVQRVPGVQVARDRGEAASFAVRGLLQVDTLLNGREIFTAGGGRNLDLSDLPAEMLAAIDVHKTVDAGRPEGGIGGTLDLRTRRPLDFGGNTLRATLRRVQGDLVDQGAWQGSLMHATRHPLAGGSFGLLANIVAQQRAWREDQKSLGLPVQRSDIVDGSTLLAPGGSSESASRGTRGRQALSLVAQWRAAAGHEWLVEWHRARLSTRQDTQQINVGPGTGFEPGSVQLFDGTQELRRITWTGAPVSLLGFARDTVDNNAQLAAGGRLVLDERWSLLLDASRTSSRQRLFFSGPILAATAARFTQDMGSDPASTQVPGDELLQPASWRYTGMAYRVRPFAGTLDALRAELHGTPAWPGVDSLAGGWRLGDRRADNAPGLVFGDAAVPGSLSGSSGGLRGNPATDFLGDGGSSITRTLVPDLGDARDPLALRQRLGIASPLPTAGNPLGVWQVRERTQALWLRADLNLPATGAALVLGLRAVHTDAELTGTRSAPDSGGTLPIQVANRQTDWLPSALLRGPAGDGLAWRLAASRSLARPGFDQLSPSLTLVPNTVSPSLNSGSAGNPQLRPVRAANLDAALESAAGGRAAWTATAFWKWVDGFIASASQPETWDGAVYQVTRPYNSDPARLAGLELATRQAWPGQPGLGLQANYTFTASHAPNRLLGRDTALQNLSRHTANLMLWAESDRGAFKLAWNGRSSFLSGVSQVVGLGAQQQVTRGYGWLDASLSWHLRPGVNLALEGGNLLRTRRSATLGSAGRPLSYWLNDRQWVLALNIGG